jgi:hypothetical protein
LGDLILPPWVRVSAGRPRAIANTESSPSIFTQATRSVGRTGDRFGFGISTANASEREDAPTRAFLATLSAELRGEANRLWFAYPGYQKRGSFPAVELLANSDFRSGTTSWSTSSANLVITATDRVLRSKRASVSADETIRAASITTVAGAVYIARVMAYAGRGPMDYRLRFGTTAGGNELAGEITDWIAPGMRTLVATATGTTTHFSIVDGTSSRSIGHYMDFPYISVSRCALVAGAAQTGSALNIDQLPASANGLARIGDWCQIGNQLCPITAALDSDASGTGVLRLAYPPRFTPADNAPVIFHQPMGRFVKVGNESPWEDAPGITSNFDLEIAEALD